MTTEFASPPAAKPFPVENLGRLVFKNAQEAPHEVAVLRLEDGDWKDVTCARYLRSQGRGQGALSPAA